MSSIYSKILKERYQIINPLEIDYKSVENLDYEDLNFHNVRGNWRLTQGKVLLPKEFGLFKERVANLIFP